jgi:hypothetical protein
MAVVETIKDDVMVDDVAVKIVGDGGEESVLSTKFALQPSLYAEDGESNTKIDCLPLAADLLATCRAKRGASRR